MSSSVTIDSEPAWAKEYIHRKDVFWYLPNIDHVLTSKTRLLLETYSNIPADQILSHVNTIRDKAWAVRSHMCTGKGLFLNRSINRHPQYDSILEQLKDGARLIDVGTFIGQDLRRISFDGAPSNHIYAVDIVDHWEIGYEMYHDRAKFNAQFIDCDILDPNAQLKGLNGMIDVIWITHLLHQWTWEGQVIVAKNLVALSHIGTSVMGFQVGAEPAKFQAATETMKVDSFLHDSTSFTRMWRQVGQETGSKWQTQAQFRSLDSMGWDEDELPADRGWRILEFSVKRIA